VTVVIETRDLAKSFGEVTALSSIDLSIEQGEIVGVIGASGSGKTTLLRLLLGLYEPTRGEVSVLGQEPSQFGRRDRERIGYLPQHFLLYPDLSARQNLSFSGGMYGLSWLERRRRIPNLLDLVQLKEAADRLASNISGGMQRRLALACVLIHRPSLIILDEPTAGLDPVLREQVWEIFDYMRGRGATLVVTTQYVTEMEYCDRVFLINRGSVVAAGAPLDLRRRAFGGDVVRMSISELTAAVVGEVLELPFVRQGNRLPNGELELIVEDASEAIPRLTEAVLERGREVLSIEEYRASFDRIFVELIEQAERSHAPAA
jgi:ABC-2 type transport system ATP-binding protein